jgi:RecA/RadA recombinase
MSKGATAEGKELRDLSPAERREKFLKRQKAINKKEDFTLLKTDQIEELVPFGFVSLDHSLRFGGMPRGRGRVIEIHGPEHSHKSTCAYGIIGNFQRATGEGVWIGDHENTLNNEYLKNLPIDRNLIEVRNPRSIEESVQLAIEAMEEGVRLFMFDSVPTMKPRIDKKLIKSGEAFGHTVGVHSRAMQTFFDVFIPLCQETNSAVILINQQRSRIESSQEARSASKYPTYWNLDYTLPGGRALRYRSSIMIETKIRKGYKPCSSSDTEWLVPPLQPGQSKDEIVAIEIKFRSLKNKVTGGGYRSSSMFARPGFGFDDNITVRQLAKEFGLIDYSGKKWFVGESIDDPIIVYNTKVEAIEDLVVRSNEEVLSKLRPLVVERVKSDQSNLEEVSQEMIDYLSGESDAVEAQVVGAEEASKAWGGLEDDD